MHRFATAFILFVLAALPAARALEVFNYSAAAAERLSSGFPNSPVVNPSFFLAGYDLSGLGWTSGNFGVTLISPQHLLTAALAGYAFGTYVSAIPEPSTWAALAGLVVLAVACHRRGKARSD